jgi:hypothetical protein
MIELATLIAQLCIGAAAVLAAWLSWRTAGRVKEIHLQINSRFDEFLKVTRELGQTEGAAAALANQKMDAANAAAQVLESAATRAAEVLAKAVEEAGSDK